MKIGQPTAGSTCRQRHPILEHLEEEVQPSAIMPPQRRGRPARRRASRQLAEEDRVERHRGGEHLDHLVRFLLDQVGQQHGREQEGEVKMSAGRLRAMRMADV